MALLRSTPSVVSGWALFTLIVFALGSLAGWLTWGQPARRQWPTWDALLSSGRGVPHERLADALADEQEALRLTLRLAHAERARGAHEEAVRVTREAAAFVVRHVPSARERLWTWWAIARALMALQAPPRLPLAAFRTWRLRSATLGETMLRPLLDDTRRFGLRVRLLAYGFGVVSGAATAAIDETVPDDRRLMLMLERLEGVAADMGTLDRASLDVLKALIKAGATTAA